jgi:SAM-dependent methyltransferase
MKPEKRSSFEINTVIQMTQPTQDSVFLDVGSGTGHLVAALEYEGYRVYGIDKSPAMVERCEKSFPNSEIVCKDVLDTMAFEHNTFSHILCTGMTIYEIQDKEAFFKNCYYWLLPNGYLILHLVHRDKFNTIVPAAQTAFLQTNTGSKKQGEDRITKTNIDFPGFSYFSEYIFPKSDSTVLFTEKFSNSNGNIRQNEQTLYMDSIDSILKIAIRRGFIVHSKMNMSKANGDENQYLYVLERAM